MTPDYYVLSATKERIKEMLFCGQEETEPWELMIVVLVKLLSRHLPKAFLVSPLATSHMVLFNNGVCIKSRHKSVLLLLERI